jgi:hypothetical protein
VPDNDSHEGSVRLLFDEHNHPVDSKKLEAKERAHCQWKRCHKLVSLIHTNRAGEFFLYAGLEVTLGADHECPILCRLVGQFVAAHGKGVMKRRLAAARRNGGIDVLIPAKSNMDIFVDVVGLAEGGRLNFEPWVRPERVRKREQARQEKLAKLKAEAKPEAESIDPSKIRIRSEVSVIQEEKTFSSCPVPLNVTVNREIYADGHYDYWVLLDTAPVFYAGQSRQDYRLRPHIE